MTQNIEERYKKQLRNWNPRKITIKFLPFDAIQSGQKEDSQLFRFFIYKKGRS